MTYQIVYASVASTPMQSDELEDLLESAQSPTRAKASRVPSCMQTVTSCRFWRGEQGGSSR